MLGPSGKSTSPGSSIGRRLILWTVLCSSLITLITTGLQLFLEYNRDVDKIEQSDSQIRDIHLGNLINSVWVSNEAQIILQLEGLARLQDIEYLEISVENKVRWSGGAQIARYAVTFEHPLVFTYDDKPITIGNLVVVASLEGIYDRLSNKAIVILGSNAIKTFLVVGFMFFLFRHLVTRHLLKLAEHVRKMSEGELDIAIGFKGEDEIAMLGNSFNRMSSKIKKSFDQINKSNANLTENVRFNTALIETIPDLIWLKNTDGVYLSCNSKFARLMGMKQSEIIGKTDYDLDDEETAKIIREADQIVMHTGILLDFEKLITYSDDKHQELIEVVKTPMYSANGKITGVLGIGRDITNRRNIEEKLRRSQKMEAIGQLTSGIAHDFNNILAIIMGNLELLEDVTGDDKYVSSRIKKAQQGAYRGAKITRKLLSFSRKEIIKTNLIVVNEFIGNMENLLSKSLTASIKVETRLANDLWTVAVDSGDFENAIVNLSINARDAMPNGGILSIETTNKTLDEDYARRNPGGKAGEFVMISVSDTGIGMSVELKEKVLDPFFTTKEQGKGTGLGLSMVYGFVQRSNGHLKIYSELGKGTTFRLYLPRSKASIRKHKTIKTDIEALPKGSEKILIVDDEEELRDVAVSFLKRLGYETLVAESSQKAIELIERNQTIDLMFSDVVMPGKIDGFELAAMAQKKNPSLKFLLTSGHTKSRLQPANDKEGFLVDLNNRLLDKPYSMAELAFALQKTLSKSN